MANKVRIFILAVLLSSCAGVKPIDNSYFSNDRADLYSRILNEYENNIHFYREGSSGGNKAKKGGGCGCN